MLSDLAVTPIAETIYRIAAERRSGDLQVTSGTISKMVFFDHGRIVFAASNLKEDRLGEALVELGQITDEQFTLASGLMIADRKLRFGDALVQAGVMDKHAVGTSVANQVGKIVLSLFKLESGTTTFEERPCTIPLEYMVSVPVQRLLLSGINAMKSPALVQAGVGDMDRVVRLAPVPPFTFKPERLPVAAQEVLAAAAEPAPIRRLASGPKGVTFGRLRAVYALLSAGVLENETGAATPEARPQVESENRGFLLSNRQRRPEPPAVEPAPAAPAPEPPPAPAATPVPEVTPPAPVAAEPAAEAVSPEVDRLLNQARVCESLSDHSGLMQVYARLVEISPNVAEYRARLGALMLRFPQTLRQAERQLNEALRLDPNNAETHYQLGLYYRKAKIHSRAIAEFRSALRIDPHHANARAELASASPDDNVFGAIKKMFG